MSLARTIRRKESTSAAEAVHHSRFVGMAEQAAEKLSCAVILSEAKNLLVIKISKMQFLRRLRLLRMTVLWEFFSNL